MLFFALSLTSVYEKTAVSVTPNIAKKLHKNRNFRILGMQHIKGIFRLQMLISSLEEAISPDNQVRFIDAFVENKERIRKIN
jgi:hypothetical protein